MSLSARAWAVESPFAPPSASRALGPAFFERDTCAVARDLLGKVVAVRTPAGGWRAGRIVETEAYQGDDPASHSARGMTPRCAPMFERGGIAYVYFIYGMYEMLNFVTEREGYPGAVLIRGLEPLHGVDGAMNGPGKLTKALGVGRGLNRAPLQGPGIFVWDDGTRPLKAVATPRVGIREGQEKFWRYCVAGHGSVSRTPLNRLARRIRI